MLFRDPLSRERVFLAGGLYVASLVSAVAAGLHAAAVGEAAFFCGAAEAHCWACYAAPLLAALGVAVLAAPTRAEARAGCKSPR